ncbi:MAG: hypothetical protein JXA73_11480 [Acidobacteria bacterium]|nr:hypothetical protein [Acidobacteriota bacterium]
MESIRGWRSILKRLCCFTYLPSGQRARIMVCLWMTGAALGALTMAGGGVRSSAPGIHSPEATPYAGSAIVEARAGPRAVSNPASLACNPASAGIPSASTPQSSQRRPCSKPKVYLRVAFPEGVERYLNEDRGQRTNEEWLNHISETAAEWLSELGAEGIEIIPWEQKVFTDDRPETPEAENEFSRALPGEYVVTLNLGLASRRNVMTGMRNPRETDYSAQASLKAVEDVMTGFDNGSAENENLEKAIGGALSRLVQRGLADRIARYEATSGSALRDPTLTASLLGPREWVSPEPDERATDIMAVAIDCLGRRLDRTQIFYQHDPGRARVEAVDVREITHFSWRPFDIAETNVTASARLKYSLEEGTDPGSEPVEIFVLARSGQQIRQVVFAPIKGLLLEIRPSDRYLWPGEKTTVRLRLFKTSHDGSREPLGPRSVQVKVVGRMEGSLDPSGAITTNDQGEATLTYAAGRSSGTVKIVGTYQPMGYKERVTAEAAVTVVDPTSGGGVGEFEVIRSTDKQDRFHHSTTTYVARGRVRFQPMIKGYWFPCKASVSSHDSSVVTHPRPENEADSYYDEWADDEVACHLEYQWPRERNYVFVIEPLRQGWREVKTYDPEGPKRHPPKPVWTTKRSKVKRSDVRIVIHVLDRDGPAPGTLRLTGKQEKDIGWLKETTTWSFRLREPTKGK